jgi:hypothetical protein
MEFPLFCKLFDISVFECLPDPVLFDFGENLC